LIEHGSRQKTPASCRGFLLPAAARVPVRIESRAGVSTTRRTSRAAESRRQNATRAAVPVRHSTTRRTPRSKDIKMKYVQLT
jgi:hypothetical protein